MNSKRTAVLAVLAVILGIGIIAFVVPIIQNHTMEGASQNLVVNVR